MPDRIRNIPCAHRLGGIPRKARGHKCDYGDDYRDDVAVVDVLKQLRVLVIELQLQQQTYAEHRQRTDEHERVAPVRLVTPPRPPTG